MKKASSCFVSCLLWDSVTGTADTCQQRASLRFDDVGYRHCTECLQTVKNWEQQARSPWDKMERERVVGKSVSVFGSCLSGGALMNLALPRMIRDTNTTMLTPWAHIWHY